MMVECYLCKKEYLTEADPHAFVFVKGNWENNCGCYFLQDLKRKNEELQKEAAAYKAILDIRNNKD